MVPIINGIAWIVWFVTLIIIHWGNSNYWMPVGFCILAVIPFIIISFKFWG